MPEKYAKKQRFLLQALTRTCESQSSWISWSRWTDFLTFLFFSQIFAESRWQIYWISLLHSCKTMWRFKVSAGCVYVWSFIYSFYFIAYGGDYITDFQIFFRSKYSHVEYSQAHLKLEQGWIIQCPEAFCLTLSYKKTAGPIRLLLFLETTWLYRLLFHNALQWLLDFEWRMYI